ncbi:hypothetical protein GCM10011503_09790 [Henriciella pelagia]|uniref:Uncharacterized protein n=1 Tax=Henriciella pelagia TaxID=1977912 RepID=A0ABQ1JBD5_9PROT|nr:hypothetical protein GCM10011503_09790 [Henriciella pelagia]
MLGPGTPHIAVTGCVVKRFEAQWKDAESRQTDDASFFFWGNQPVAARRPPENPPAARNPFPHGALFAHLKPM